MRKIILLSDTHVHLEKPLYGWDVWERLDACLMHIQEHHSDASAIFILGDVAHKGDSASYECLAMRLASLGMPVIPVPGNHDDAAVMERLFPAQSDGIAPNNGLSMTRSWTLPEAQCLFMHTQVAGQCAGALAEEDAERLRLAMLKAKDGVGNGNVFAFMHHPPLQSGIAAADAAGLIQRDVANNDALLEAAAMVNPVHGPRLTLICGHIHRTIAGRFHGLPVLTLRGIMPEVAFAQDPTIAGFTGLDTPPSYGVLMLGDGNNGDFSSMALHEEFFMEKVANFSI